MLKPVLASLVIGVGLPAAAAPVYDVDFDNTAPTYAQGDGSGTRTLTYTTGGTSTADGVGGTKGSKYTFDLTGLSGFTFNNPFYQINNTTGFLGATSTDVNDYEVSFDIRAEGMTGSSVGATFDLRLGDANFTSSVTYTGTYAKTTLNLGDIASDTNFDLTDFTASSGSQRQFKFTVFGSGDAGKFGYDSGNALYLDNFQINEIPEPASMALIGLGSLCLLGRRRARV